MGRQRARSRAALIRAAQSILATRGSTAVPIQEITDTADVGLGTFYNHFETKDELFETAVTELLEAHAARLDEITAGMDDPAEVFAASWRLTAALAHSSPQVARVFVHAGLSQIASDRGLAPQALRDIENAVSAGRFDIDPQVALALTAGCLLAHMQLMLDRPQLLGDRATEHVVTGLLVMFGLTKRQARAVAFRELPRADDEARPGRRSPR